MDTKLDWRCETLPEGAVLTRRDAAGACILCVSGRLWVTEAGLAADHMLRSGEHCLISQPGLVVIEALRDAMLVVTDATGHYESSPLRRIRRAKKTPPGLGE